MIGDIGPGGGFDVSDILLTAASNMHDDMDHCECSMYFGVHDVQSWCLSIWK